MNKVYVIGIGFRPLGEKAGYVVQKSDAVLSSKRLVEVFQNYREYDMVRERIIVHGSVYEMLDYIAANYQLKKISVLAAGDPMFFGIGRLIIERLGKESVEVYPDLSSVQVAFSKIKETSNNALPISLHGGPDPEKRRKLEYELDDVPLLLTRHSKIAVLTDNVNSPEVIAKKLYGPSARPYSGTLELRMYVCEKLGYPEERITEGTPEEIANMTFGHPNVVIIVQKSGGTEAQSAETSFGLRENEISHSKGLVTKDEVRAVTIHKLKLPLKGVLWDIGAGSGSVSVESARLCPGVKVFAIEKDTGQISHITANRNRFNAGNMEVVEGAAPDVLMDLPAPDRVFIGGSSGKLDDIIHLIAGQMRAGIIVVNAVTIETLNEAVKGLEGSGFAVDICEVSVSRSKMVGNKRHMSALNPVYIISGEK